MSFDFGAVLTRAWKITWNHKIFWVFGLFSMMIGLLFLPLAFAPAISIFMSEANTPFWLDQPAYIIAYAGLFMILMIASFFIGALVQAVISCGVLRVERGEEKLSFAEALKAGYPFFGRFLGITLLYVGGILLVVFAIFALQMLVTVFTFGLGAMCLIPLQFLLYPLMFVAYACLEQALASVVVDGLGVFEAVRRGWGVFRKNLMPVLLMTLIMYLGVGMLSGFIYIPVMLPLFAAPLIAIEGGETGRTILLVAVVCLVVYLPVLAVFQSVAFTFMKSGWILTYLRLTRNPETEVLASPSA
jgi:hypothetical protein